MPTDSELDSLSYCV